MRKERSNIKFKLFRTLFVFIVLAGVIVFIKPLKVSAQTPIGLKDYNSFLTSPPEPEPTTIKDENVVCGTDYHKCDNVPCNSTGGAYGSAACCYPKGTACPGEENNYGGGGGGNLPGSGGWQAGSGTASPSGTTSGTGTEVNVRCKCSGDFNACGNYFGLTNNQYKECKRDILGRDRCNYKVGTSLYLVQSCTGAPTVTPGGTGTTPAPTVNPNCKCSGSRLDGILGTNNQQGSSCSKECSFDRYGDVTYASQIGCTLDNNIFQSSPTADDKQKWCQASKRTKGDADGNGTVNFLDYFYFVSVKSGAKIPTSVNPDFSGDDKIDDSDRAIIIKSLK